jgi:hypothetical protein
VVFLLEYSEGCTSRVKGRVQAATVTSIHTKISMKDTSGRQDSDIEFLQDEGD